jgi:hypothetical protein
MSRWYQVVDNMPSLVGPLPYLHLWCLLNLNRSHLSILGSVTLPFILIHSLFATLCRQSTFPFF